MDNKILSLVNNPLKMNLFLLWKLPSAWFMGIKVRSCSLEQSELLLPFSWRAQNPFRSTYFAAQCAAAELSTGILGMAHMQGKPLLSMLVLRIEADFLKKASDVLCFTCTDGAAFQKTIELAAAGQGAQIIQASSIGRLPDGTEAVRVNITWSFKLK